MTLNYILDSTFSCVKKQNAIGTYWSWLNRVVVSMVESQKWAIYINMDWTMLDWFLYTPTVDYDTNISNNNDT